MATRDELVSAVMLFVQVAAAAQAAIAACAIGFAARSGSADKKPRILLFGLAARAREPFPVRFWLLETGRGNDRRLIRTAKMPLETPAQAATVAPRPFVASPCP